MQNYILFLQLNINGNMFWLAGRGRLERGNCVCVCVSYAESARVQEGALEKVKHICSHQHTASL